MHIKLGPRQFRNIVLELPSEHEARHFVRLLNLAKAHGGCTIGQDRDISRIISSIQDALSDNDDKRGYSAILSLSNISTHANDNQLRPLPPVVTPTDPIGPRATAEAVAEYLGQPALPRKVDASLLPPAPPPAPSRIPGLLPPVASPLPTLGEILDADETPAFASIDFDPACPAHPID